MTIKNYFLFWLVASEIYTQMTDPDGNAPYSVQALDLVHSPSQPSGPVSF